MATGLVADEFDLSFFQEKGLDHGCFSPLSLLWPHEKEWPGAIVPLQVGVLQVPIPSARRCFKLGRALRKAIESFPEDIKDRVGHALWFAQTRRTHDSVRLSRVSAVPKS